MTGLYLIAKIKKIFLRAIFMAFLFFCCSLVAGEMIQLFKAMFYNIDINGKI